MEEIVTIDGIQFKLTVDRPLTEIEKVQVLADIRKQTGCGTCGQPKIARMGNDWQYGGIKSLPAQVGNPPTCPAAGASGGPKMTVAPFTYTPKVSGDGVTMAVKPVQGVAPYQMEFFRSAYNDMGGNLAAAMAVSIDASRLAGLPDIPATNPTSKTIAEGTTITVTYTLDVDDLNGATTKAGDEASGPSLLFASQIIDSCIPGSTCANYCKIFVGCVAPRCDFTVT